MSTKHAKTMVQVLDASLHACREEARRQGYAGHPDHYDFTEHDCLTIADELDEAGLQVVPRSRKSLAALHDACLVHDEHGAA